MEINDMRSVLTLLAFITFIGIVLWAYHSKSRPGFDEAAQLPFADDE
jgi:cytochrome c oxidase cbb3-type subunit IV